MTFEQWYNNWIDNGPDLSPKDLAKEAWEYQQEHIVTLAETIEDFEKIIQDCKKIIVDFRKDL